MGVDGDAHRIGKRLPLESQAGQGPGERLPVIRVGRFPSKRVRQAGSGLHRAVTAREEEGIAIWWLHLDAVATTNTRIHFDTRNRKPVGSPPLGQ